MHTQPVIHALIASFLALGTAGGEKYLKRAGNLLRDLAHDPAVDTSTAAILEDILAGVDEAA